MTAHNPGTSAYLRVPAGDFTDDEDSVGIGGSIGRSEGTSRSLGGKYRLFTDYKFWIAHFTAAALIQKLEHDRTLSADKTVLKPLFPRLSHSRT